MARWQSPAEIVAWIPRPGRRPHARLAWRVPVVTGMPFARGRRTVARCLRAGGPQEDYRASYYFPGSLGREARFVGGRLPRLVVDEIAPGNHWPFAIDDTPTRRYDPNIDGVRIHHDPTPGPAGRAFLHGHGWVTAAWVIRHTRRGVIGPPSRAPFMYAKSGSACWIRRTA